MNQRSQIGIGAEREAERWFLERFEARLLRRNYRCRAGEIDLIFEESKAEGAQRSLELVFVEVRSRQHGGWCSAVESVSFPKRRRLGHAVRHFLARYRGGAASLRLDILARDGECWTHLRNVLLEE